MTTTPKSLEVRLTEYRDNLRSIAAQIANLASTMRAAEPDYSTEPLDDLSRSYNLIADDLTKIIEGTALAPFVVTGEL